MVIGIAAAVWRNRWPDRRMRRCRTGISSRLRAGNVVNADFSVDSAGYRPWGG